MVEKARENAEKAGYNNVEFRLGDIENMPVASNIADVVVSNCVLNLVPNKHKVFSEIFRVLRPGAHFSIADIVTKGQLPEKWKQVAALYAGCVAGAMEMDAYLAAIKEAGFTAIALQKEKKILLPEEILLQHLSAEETAQFKNSDPEIVSITVYAEKPAKDNRNCCGPGAGCC